MSGDWERDGSALVSFDLNCILKLKRDVPEAYEIRSRFVRLEGEYSIAFFISMNGTIGSVSLDSWGRNLNGVQTIGGLSLKDSGGYEFEWKNGRAYELRARVENGIVTTWVDGDMVEVAEVGKMLLGVVEAWDWTPEKGTVGLAIGAWNCPTRFESFEWREIEAK